MCPPGGNDSTAFAADYVDHYDLNVFEKADGYYAVFSAAAGRFLECRSSLFNCSKIRIASWKSM
jgi:hypothetical protein